MFNKFFLPMIFLIIFAPLLWAQSKSDICTKKGRIRYLESGKEIEIQQGYCWNTSKDSFYSIVCRKEACLAMQLEDSISQKSLFLEYGKPGFHLCRLLRGDPRVVYYFVGGQWLKSDQCLFSDQSFINTAYLYERHSRAFWRF